MQELVPEAQVPERAVRRAALDHQRLIGREVEAAHRVGGVGRRPPVGHRRDAVGLGDGVRLTQTERHQLGLLADPREGGREAAGKVGVVLSPSARGSFGFDLPLDAVSAPRVDDVVARDGADGIGLELEPGSLVVVG